MGDSGGKRFVQDSQKFLLATFCLRSGRSSWNRRGQAEFRVIWAGHGDVGGAPQLPEGVLSPCPVRPWEVGVKVTIIYVPKTVHPVPADKAWECSRAGPSSSCVGLTPVSRLVEFRAGTRGLDPMHPTPPSLPLVGVCMMVRAGGRLLTEMEGKVNLSRT